MSLRSFTVFQDVVPSDALQPKISRPNAMIARSSLNVASPTNATSTTSELLALDKENYHPVTGERAGPSNIGTKRKTTVLAIKVQPEPATKSKNNKESDREPEQKKRKPSTSSALKGKVKKNGKGTGSTKKSTSKRAPARKVSPMPKLNEEEESEKEPITQANIDSRCYELTVKPLADVSQAYEEAPLLEAPPACTGDTSEEKVQFHANKASSVEPEIRDYFQPSQAAFSSSSTNGRMRAMSEDVSEGRAFSTPERKQIYAAFTFSSPSNSSGRMSKASHSGSVTPADLA